MSTLIIDVKNTAYRAGWRYRSMIAPNGHPCGALFGVLKLTMSALRRFPETTTLVLACDPVIEKKEHWRVKLFPDYKSKEGQKYNADQHQLAKNVMSGLAEFREICTMLPVVWLEDPEFEADDLIAYEAATRALPQQVIIVSKDNDMFQLAAYPNVSIAYPAGSVFEIINASNFGAAVDKILRDRNKKTKNWPDMIMNQREYVVFKVFLGDSSDNIAGLRGVATVTALKMLKLIRDSGREIPAHPAEAFKSWWECCQGQPNGAAKSQAKIARTNPQAKDILTLGYKLMVLIDGMEVTRVHSFQGQFWQGQLAETFMNYGFHEFIDPITAQLSDEFMQTFGRLTGV